MFSWIFSTILLIIDSILGLKVGNFGSLEIIYALILLVPNLAVSVRRLHDIGKSGWMLFVALIPFAGIIWLIVLFATEGAKGENQYGLDPKEVAVEV